MPTLHLMVGLPCSGKTTYAKKIEKECNALRLTPDIWHLQLFGQDAEDDAHNKSHDTIEKIMWDVAERVLTLGNNVILDFGLWAKVERDDFRARAKALGADCKIHFMDVPTEELFRRLEIRNENHQDKSFIIQPYQMEEYIKIFQPPMADEISIRVAARSSPTYM